MEEFRVLNDKMKKQQGINFNKRHRVYDRPDLKPGQKVWIVDLKRYGVIKGEAGTPRSYTVLSYGRIIRRNKLLLKTIQNEEDQDYSYSFPDNEQDYGKASGETSSTIQSGTSPLRTRSGRGWWSHRNG